MLIERYEAVGSQEKTALQADFRRECVITSKFSIVQFLVTVDIKIDCAPGRGFDPGPGGPGGGIHFVHRL